MKILGKNKKAYFNYQILQEYVCGIVLQGTEVKSIRENRFSFIDAFGEIRKNEVYVNGIHINPYSHASIFNHQAVRRRKILLQRSEINYIQRHIMQKGVTLVPLCVGLDHGLVKIVMGLAKGKKMHDKRQSIKERDNKRALSRVMKAMNT